MYSRSSVLFLVVMIAICVVNVLAAPSPQAGADAQAVAMKNYVETVAQGDAQVASGDYFEAVRTYEQAGRIAYNNKLGTDRDALDKRLAAARLARDAKQNAPAAATPPAGTPTKGAASTPTAPTGATLPTGSGTAVTPMQDYERTVRYGDELVGVGEYQDAVLAYERARRLAYNNKLTTDAASLEARLANAKTAAKLPRPVPTELVPPVPPLVPHPPDEVDSIVWLTKEPGTFLPWNLHREGFVVDETRATTAELKALEVNLQRIAAVVKKVPVFNPPTGFDVYSSSALSSFEAVADQKRALALNFPLMSDVYFAELGKFQYQVQSKSTGKVSNRVATQEEPSCGLRFNVNSLPLPGVHYEDSEGTFLFEPLKKGEIGGIPVYDDMVVITRPGDKLWVPVTRGRVLKYLIPKYKSDIGFSSYADADTRKNRQAELSPDRIAQWRREEAEARAKGGPGAEQNARHLETMHRRWEEDARKALAQIDSKSDIPARTQTLKAAEAMLADPASHTAPACVITSGEAGAAMGWRVVPVGTPGCRAMVKGNRDLLNPKLPRSALQIIYVDNITNSTKTLQAAKSSRENAGDCVAATNLIRQLNWQELLGLLQK
jgi:tetratricopeptide (TPR) repeat protein